MRRDPMFYVRLLAGWFIASIAIAAFAFVFVPDELTPTGDVIAAVGEQLVAVALAWRWATGPHVR